MCLLVVVSRVLPQWPLVVGANRDERLERPAAPMGVLRSRAPVTIGGHDLLAGGTWLAVNNRGVVAGLTNKPSPEGRDPTKRSRGQIPLVLTTRSAAKPAVAMFAGSFRPDDVNPCWVLAGDRDSLFWIDLTDPREVHVTALPPGVHVLENKALDEPSGKVDRVRQLLGEVDGLSGDEVLDRIAGILTDHVVTEPLAGGAREAERRSLASACCVHGKDYGTRCSTLVRVPAGTGPPEVLASDGPSCRYPLVPATFPAGTGGPSVDSA